MAELRPLLDSWLLLAGAPQLPERVAQWSRRLLKPMPLVPERILVRLQDWHSLLHLQGVELVDLKQRRQ